MFISKKAPSFFLNLILLTRQLTDLHVKYLRVIMWIGVPEKGNLFLLGSYNRLFYTFLHFLHAFFCIFLEI